MKATFGGKYLFGLCFHMTVDHQGIQDRNSNSVGDRRQELMQRMWGIRFFLVACSPCLPWPA